MTQILHFLFNWRFIPKKNSFLFTFWLRKTEELIFFEKLFKTHRNFEEVQFLSLIGLDHMEWEGPPHLPIESKYEIRPIQIKIFKFYANQKIIIINISMGTRTQLSVIFHVEGRHGSQFIYENWVVKKLPRNKQVNYGYIPCISSGRLLVASDCKKNSVDSINIPILVVYV